MEESYRNLAHQLNDWMKRRDWAEVPFQCWSSPVMFYIWWNQTDTKQPQAPWGVLLAGTWLKRGTKGSQAHGMSLDNLTTSWTSARKSICQQGKEAGCCAVTKLCRASDPNHYFMHVTSPYGSKIFHHCSDLSWLYLPGGDIWLVVCMFIDTSWLKGIL